MIIKCPLGIWKKVYLLTLNINLSKEHKVGLLPAKRLIKVFRVIINCPFEIYKKVLTDARHQPLEGLGPRLHLHGGQVPKHYHTFLPPSPFSPPTGCWRTLTWLFRDEDNILHLMCLKEKKNRKNLISIYLCKKIHIYIRKAL